MSDDLIPEMHDIGKLVDKSIMGERNHNFTDIDESYKDKIRENANWDAIKYHHVKNVRKLPKKHCDDSDLFLLKLSDRMASAVSRMLQKEEKKEFNKAKEDKERKKPSVCKLWNTKERVAELISDDEEFLELIDFVNNYSSSECTQYFEKYGKRLEECPEDNFPGLNVTSLSTHSKIVGRFYRFFKKYINDIKDNKTTLGQKLDVNKAENTFVIKLVRGKIRFHLAPVRTGDLNIFNVEERIIKSLRQRDEILFCTSDEFLMILPSNKNIGSVFGEIEESVYLDVEEAEAVLYEVYPTPVAMKKRCERNPNNFSNAEKFGYTGKAVYSELATHVQDICELCQMYEATKKFPRDYVYERLCEKCKNVMKNEEYPFSLDKLCDDCKNENEKWLEETISENVCVNCFNLRKEEPRAPKIVEWSESDEDFKVAWVKISLDIEKLQRTLEELYEIYTSEKGFKKGREGEIRFSVLSEFQSDYDEFLKGLMRRAKEDDKNEVNGKFADEFKSVNCQWILSDFFCIRMERLNDIKRILETYRNLFNKYFPKFKEADSPIKLSISCSNIKFAFFWHWKFLESPQNDINVNLVGKGEMHLNLRQLDKILKLDMKQLGTGPLHKLSEVSEVSKKLSKVLLYDKGDWRLYKECDELRSLLEGGIDFPNILTYAKMMSDQERVVK